MKISTFSQVFTFLLIAAILLVFTLGALGLRDQSKGLYTDMLEDTVRKYAIQCYALEGAYPSNIEYLAENYGLILDHDNYIYYYHRFGSNMMPDIRVHPRDLDYAGEEIIF